MKQKKQSQTLQSKKFEICTTKFKAANKNTSTLTKYKWVKVHFAVAESPVNKVSLINLTLIVNNILRLNLLVFLEVAEPHAKTPHGDNNHKNKHECYETEEFVKPED